MGKFQNDSNSVVYSKPTKVLLDRRGVFFLLLQTMYIPFAVVINTLGIISIETA